MFKQMVKPMNLLLGQAGNCSEKKEQANIPFETKALSHTSHLKFF